MHRAFLIKKGAMLNMLAYGMVERFLNESNVESWDLIKLNIEGGEYAVLKKLIDSGLICKFKHIQVQFHLNVPNARKKYKELVKQLRHTHTRQWCYPFVWESWQRKGWHEVSL